MTTPTASDYGDGGGEPVGIGVRPKGVLDPIFSPIMSEEVFARILSRYGADRMPEDLDALTRHDSRLRENVEHLIEARDALIHFGGQWELLADEYRHALHNIQQVCVNEPDAAIAATKAADLAIDALAIRTTAARKMT